MDTTLEMYSVFELRRLRLCQAETSELFSPCGRSSLPATETTVSTRAVGGKPASVGQFPWTVAIYDLLTNRFVCSGAILTRTIVLSAAHCFFRTQQAHLYYLLAGKSNLLEYEAWQQLTFGQHVIIHEDFNNDTLENDIALVKVLLDFHFDSTAVQPVCFPDNAHTLPDGTMCHLAGFGETLGTSKNEVLNYIRVPVVEDTTCSDSDWLGADFFPNVSFCAGYRLGGQDACVRDSGSALVRRHKDGHFYVYGVSSWGSGCGEVKKPGVYTEVLRYVRWVKNKVRSLGKTA